jgi:hypothetical protein
MAKTSDMNVGDFVYKPFEPLNPGMIISNKPSKNPNYRIVKTLWSNGETTEDTVMEYAYNDFTALLEDHRKKLRTHEGNLDILRNRVRNLT